MSLTNELSLTKGENHVVGPNKQAVRKLSSQAAAYLSLSLSLSLSLTHTHN